ELGGVGGGYLTTATSRLDWCVRGRPSAMAVRRCALSLGGSAHREKERVRMTRGLSRRAFLTGSLGVGALGVLVACQQAPAPTPQVVTKEVIVEKPVERVVTQVVERQVT